MANLDFVSLLNLESFVIRLTKESKLSTTFYTAIHYTCIGYLNATLQLAVHILRFLLSDLKRGVYFKLASSKYLARS